MISASHNPYEDNGIKVFASDGTKVNDADEARVGKAHSRADRIRKAVYRCDTRSNIFLHAKAQGCLERYEACCCRTFQRTPWLTGMRLVVDCANGAMSVVAPELLRRLGAEVVVTNASPNGTNINDRLRRRSSGFFDRVDEDEQRGFRSRVRRRRGSFFVCVAQRPTARRRCSTFDDGSPAEEEPAG